MFAKWKSRYFLVVILLLQFVLYTLVFFDVPVARQVIGFLYFTFIPGIVILKLLKLDEFDGLEIVLFSAGLSVAFLMFAGLLINEFSSLLGISKPLSLMPLMIGLNSFILLSSILTYLRSGSAKPLVVKTPKPHPSTLLFVGFPILSVVGTIWVNSFNNNLILLFMIILISLLFVIGIISKKLLPSKLYPLAVLIIALSLLFHSSLISNYLVSFGSDVPLEYFVFKTTENSGYWSSTNPYLGDIAYGRVNAMLSVTILPTVYSTLLNMDSTWMFKIMFPLIFSLVPLGLYKVWQIYLGKKKAFISAFLFMAQSTFYNELLGLNRQIIAELFFVLLFLVISKKMKPHKKIVYFMILSIALIMSHYALAEIFLLFISFTLVSLLVLKRPSRNITASMIVFFFVAMFSWYVYTSNSAVLDSFLSFGNYIYNQLGEFLNPASRGQTILRGLGLESPPSIWNMISRIFAYITQGFIVVGFVGLITKRIKIHLEKEYFILSTMAMVFLGALLLVPGLANTLNMTRFYHILLFFLAPFFVLGSQMFANFITKQKKQLYFSLLVVIILTPYFLFQTGFVYEVTKSQSWSMSLSLYRLGLTAYTMGFIDEQDVFGAYWMSKNIDVQNANIYADIYSRNRFLTCYGMIYRGNVNILSNATRMEYNEVIYLSRLNTVYGKIIGVNQIWNSSDLSINLLNMNSIYSNGASEIYMDTVP